MKHLAVCAQDVQHLTCGHLSSSLQLETEIKTY